MPASALIALLSFLFSLYLIVRFYNPCVELMRDLWIQFRALKKLTQIVVLCSLALVTKYGGAKAPQEHSQEKSVVSQLQTGGLVAISGVGLDLDIPDGAQVETQTLTSNQCVSGYAAIACAPISPEWVHNTDGLQLASCDRWSMMGVAEDTWWVPFPSDRALLIGTNLITEGVHIASSGIISFAPHLPRSSPTAGALPLEGATVGHSFLSVLQGPSGLIPPGGRVTATFTPSNSLLVSWHNLQLGRETNANSQATAQAEIMPAGQIFCRYSLPTNNFALTNYVVGIQNQSGGSSYRFALTNEVLANYEILFENFGYLNPVFENHDGDSLSSSYEVYVSRTNPHMADTDLDGLNDDVEVALGTDPNNRDTDGDGLVDGSDPNPNSADTADNDQDGILDVWELFFFGTLEAVNDLDADSSTSGVTGGIAMLSGIDPAFSVCAVTTSHGEHRLSWTDLADATNYIAMITCGSTTNWICSTNICSLSITGDFTAAEHTFAVIAHCASNRLTHTASQTFRQPTEPNLTVWRISDPFALESPAADTTVLERSFTINRVREWQQYYITADYQSAAGWELDGMDLHWSDSTEEAGSTNASPRADSLLLSTGAGASTLNLRLTTARAGLVKSSQPLYLIEWSPSVTIDTNAFVIADGDDLTMVLISEQDNTPTDAGFTVNTDGRPSKAALTQDQLKVLKDPFGDGGAGFTAEFDPATGLIIGGFFNAGEPGSTSMTAPGGGAAPGADGGEGGAGQGNPGAAGQGAFTLYRISPSILDFNGDNHGGLEGHCECGDPSADHYPFDTACLRKQWLYAYYYPTNVCPAGGYAGVEVSLGLAPEEAQKFTIAVNNIAGSTYLWKEHDTHANVTVSLGTNQVWSGSRQRIDMTDRCGGYWGDGPPVDITAEDDGCGCEDGCASGDCSGNDGPDLGSLKFRLSLGQSGYQQNGGFLWFKTETMPTAITPELFNVTALPSVSVTSNNNALSCVDNVAVNGRRIDVSSITGGVRFDIYRYDRSLTAVLEGGWEVTRNGSSVIFVGRDSSGNPLRHLAYNYTLLGEKNTWTENDILTGAVTSLEEQPRGQNYHTLTHKTQDAVGNVYKLSTRILDIIGTGAAAVERVTTSYEYGKYGQWESQATYSYHIDNLNPRLNGKLKLQSNDDSSWEYYLWDESGRETLRVTSVDGCARPAYLDSDCPNFNFNPAGSYANLNARITQYDYTTHAGDSSTWHDAAQSRTVTEWRVNNGSPVLIARTWHKYTRGETNILGETYAVITHTAIRSANPSAAINDPANRISIDTSFLDTYCGSLHLDGRPLYRKDEDGSTTTWEYDLDGTIGELAVTTHNGTTTSPQGLSGKSTYEVDRTDLYYGHTLNRSTWLYIDGANDAPLNAEWNDYDDKGRLLSTEYSDGTAMINEWSCCHLLQSIDRSGIITQYPMETNRLHSETLVISPGLLPGANGLYPVSGSYVDLLGRTTNSYSAGQSTITAYPEYSSHLRVTIDPLGVATTNQTSLVWDAATAKYYITEETTRAGVRTTTKRLANGEPVTTTEWTDSVSGATLKQMTKTESETQPNGWEKRTSYVKYDDGEWLTQSETLTDFLGRSVSVTTPLGTTSNFYDAATGRLVKVSRTGMADTLYGYNELGERIVTCLNVNGNETIDFEGLDRINRIDRIFELRSNDWWQVTYSELWAETNAVASITGSVTRVRMTGLGVDTYNGAILTAQSESEDELKNVTRTSTYTDAANVTTWQVTDTPESNIDAVQKSVAGYPVLSVSSTSITNSYTYDGFARIVETTEGTEDHRVKSVTAYNDFGQVAYVENAATNRNSFVYNGLGQRVASSNALGQVSYTTYNGVGNVIAIWGTSYPVAYEIDTAGRMIALATTRSNDYANVNLNSLVPLGETLSSLSLQPSSLDITRWFYDDATGLLTNKVYADGNGTAYTYTDEGRLATRKWARGVTANYSYSTSGQLTGITYNDNTTPNVNFTYDRLGRMTSATSSASTRIFEYTGLALTREMQDNYIIERIYDTLGRTIGYELYSPDDLFNPVQTIIYGYSDSGRFNSVTFVNSGVTNQCNYTYLPGTDLINGYSLSQDGAVASLTMNRSFEPYRNLITAITNAWNTAVVSSFDYHNNALGQRTKRADYFNASTINNGFTYNIFGEVTGALMNEDNYTYNNDPIGNRLQSTVDSGQSSVTNIYTSNNLNQYTSVYSVSSVVNPVYDPDGSLTFNGDNWRHSWNGENRLICSSNESSDVVCTYAYDYQGRRVSKTTLTPSPFSFLTRKYIYDGWNIIAELVSTNTSSFIPHTSSFYTWGLNLSGTLQGAGGVGGLLCETKTDSSSTNTYLTLSDANGNITEYVDDTGAVTAHYEYNAFGETPYKSGTMKDDFAIRFSSKYFDPETGFYYYGYRYYDPKIGRWLSLDPIGERGGVALYGFVGNQTINYVDSLGLSIWSYVELSACEGHNAGCGEWNRKDEGFTGKGNQQSYVKHFEVEVLGNSKAAFLKIPYRVVRPMAEEIVEKIGIPKDDNETLWAMSLGKSVLFYKPIRAIADSTCSSGKRCARDLYFKGEVTQLEKFNGSDPLIIYPPKGSNMPPQRKFATTKIYSIPLECTK